MNVDSRMKEQVRIVYHPMYITNYPQVSCESPDRVQSIMSVLSKHFTVEKPTACSDEDVLLCHSRGLLEMERTADERFPVAKMAAGGAILSAELALKGYAAFGVIRPPGHHANPDHNWGFCFFNNMGIALSKLLKEEKIRSAVVLDIDLHFGDGTDAIFRSQRNVSVINIQASNPDDFIGETHAELAKVKEADIIGISAGFDQYELDWGANLSTDNYRTIGEIAGAFAREKANGRIFGILEGGYYVPDLGKNLLALLEGMVKGRTEGP